MQERGTDAAAALCRTLVRVAALAWLTCCAPRALAEPAMAGGLQTDTRLYVAGASALQRGAGGTAHPGALAASAELRFLPRGRDWHAGLFLETQVPLRDRASRSIGTGAYLRRDFGRWDATAVVLNRFTNGRRSRQFYAGRLRYRLADRHKIGAELKGEFGTHRPQPMQLGYYASLSDRLSLNVIAGPFDRGTARIGARLELVWRLR